MTVDLNLTQIYDMTVDLNLTQTYDMTNFLNLRLSTLGICILNTVHNKDTFLYHLN